MEYKVEDIIETEGYCNNCGNFDILGNGVCANCWDILPPNNIPNSISPKSMLKQMVDNINRIPLSNNQVKKNYRVLDPTIKRKVGFIQYYCLQCGTPIFPSPYRLRKGNGIYCKPCNNKINNFFVNVNYKKKRLLSKNRQHYIC